MQSVSSSTVIPLANVPQATSSASSLHPQSQSHPTIAAPNAVTHPVSQLHQPQSATPSTGRTQHASIFHFRSERAQWLALAGIILALVALITAWVYAANAQRLAEWEAEKDYQLYCQGLKSSANTVPSDCDAILNLLLPPPPGHKSSFFIRIWAKVRRANINILKLGVSDTAHTPLWLYALIFITVFAGSAWILYQSADFEDSEEAELPPFRAVSTTLMPIGLRVLFSACWQIFGAGPGLAKMMIFMCWTAGHAWAIYGSRELLGGNYDSVLQIWTLLGLLNGIFTDRYSTLLAFISHILALSSAEIFIESPRWLDLEHNNYCHIKGPNLRWIVWNLGHYGSQIGGILALRDILWGCSVLGLKGFWVVAEDSPEPMLPLIINPLVIVYLCCCGALFFDIFGHLALHRWWRLRGRR
ncbi:hypothetical protein N431DRAFT_437428 [Stipitochalara longipes BDJ]|nr:hypothetical protein N431DRAFT_437428 [Stipitochalara longipes BDJ]